MLFLTQKTMKKIFFLLLAIVPSLAWSQVRLSGTVTEKQGATPLPGAHVIIENTFLTEVTDASGHFQFPVLKKGTYDLKVSFIGFQTVTRTLSLTKDTVISIDLQEAAILGEEVNITATRAGEKYPVAYSTLTKKDIEKANLGKDIPYIIQNTPSVVVTSDAGTGVGYTGMSIRGTDLTRINVTIDGIPLNDAETQGVWFVDIPDIASSTTDIQIQRGVGTSTNGSGAFGATLNIQTTTHQPDPYGELSVSGGSYGTARGSASFGTGTFGKNFTVDGRVSFLTSDGYIDRASSDLRSYYLSGGYYGKNTTLRLITFSGKEVTYQAWEGVPADSLKTNRTFNPAGMYYDDNGNIHYYKNQIDDFQQDHYAMVFSQKIAPGWNLNASLFYTKGFGYYENYKEDKSFEEYGLQNVIIGNDTITETDLVNRKYLDNDFYGITFSSNYQLKDKLKMVLGGGWNRYEGRHYGKVIWAQYASDGNNERNWYYSTGDKKDFNIYLKGIYTLWGKLNLFGDLQYRHVGYDLDGTLDDLRSLDQSHQFDFFNPKAGLYFDINKQQHAWCSFGMANREPSRNNYKDADPGRTPTYETLYDYELGYSYQAHPFRGSVNLYYMKYHNQLTLTGEINNVGEAIMVNVPESYRAGIEVSAGVTLMKSLNWDVTAAFSRNKIPDFTAYTDNYDADWNYLGQVATYLGETDISFSPDLNIGSIIRYMPVKGLTLSFLSKYIGRQYIDNTSDKSRSLDPWFVNNLGFEYVIPTKFFKEVGFQVTIGNIFNEEYESNGWVYPYIFDGTTYESTGWFPQAPINLMAGITLRL